MIFQSIDEIKSLIERPINKKMLERAETIRKKHELHVSGIGIDTYLDKIQGIENDKAVALRRSLSKPITVPECSKIINSFDKVFSARGGGRFYNFSNQNNEAIFKEQILSNVKNGYSIKEYMSIIWMELVNIDPNGVILAEIDMDGQAFFSYKSSDCIEDIGYKGANKIEYIIFEPEEKKEKPGDIEYYRVIDDAYDYLIKRENDNFSIVEDKTFPNPWGFVPGTFLSTRLDKKSNGFTTHIEEAMIYADDLLLDYIINKIYKTKIGIPYFWQYERQCGTCKGSGQVLFNNKYTTCNSCEGHGYNNENRDIADIIVLPLPENGDVSLNPPAGYVQPDLNTWTKQEETIEYEKSMMYLSVFGDQSYTDKSRKNYTASEIMIRENSKENKLNKFSDNEESVEKVLTDILGFYYFPNTYQGSIIANGRHFDTKTPEEIFQQYTDDLKNNVSSTKLTQTLTDYYYSLYKRSPQRLNESLVKLNTKPFFHWTPDKLKAINVDNTDYLKNLYYDEFSVYYERKVEKFGITTIDKVESELDKWILEKQNNIQNETVLSQGSQNGQPVISNQSGG